MKDVLQLEEIPEIDGIESDEVKHMRHEALVAWLVGTYI